MTLPDYNPRVAVTVHRRSHKTEKLARIYDDEIGPGWGTRCSKMLLRNLSVPERGQVLDVSCGTGYPAIEILRRLGDGSRIIAIDASSAMLDIARRKVADLGPLGKKGIFFRTESPLPKLSFANDVYDLVVCNLGLGEMPDMASAIRDFARVTKPGGQVRCTLPLAGTFTELHDIYREVLVKHDKNDALTRLEDHIAGLPTAATCERWMLDAGLVPTIEIEEFSLLFKSSREFFFAPVIEFGPLMEWKAIAGNGQDLQDTFWYIKEAIDAYYAGRPFEMTIKAACLIGRKAPDEAATMSAALHLSELHPVSPASNASLDTPPELLANPPTPLPKAADGSMRVGDSDVIEVEEISGVTGDYDVDEGAEAASDVPLDAFTEGKSRPPHLDD